MTYDQAINQAPLVLMEFYASWCPHCQKMMPIVEQVKELLDGTATVVQLDIDQNEEAANEANVQSIPTFIVYKNGKEQWRHSGEMAGEALVAKVQQFA